MAHTESTESSETGSPSGPSERSTASASRALGYASVPRSATLDGPQLARQRAAIEAACEDNELELIEIVRDREAARGGSRAGLAYLLERLEEQEATCIVVDALVRLSRNVADLAPVLDRLERAGVRLIVIDVGLDTATAGGTALMAARTGEATRTAATPEPEPARAPSPAPPAEPEVPTSTPEPVAAQPPLVAIGYASTVDDGEADTASDLEAQREAIAGACARLDAELVEIVRDMESRTVKSLDRPGLSYLMGRVAAEEANCIIVSSLERMSRSVAELAPLLHWLETSEVRLIALDLDLDTATAGGRSTARALASVGGWERDRLSERTRKGLAAARAKRRNSGGRGSGEGDDIRKRIAAMRADGMTLQAIADALNAEGVPTLRGGAQWRPSSVQTAAGYKRRPRSTVVDDLPAVKQASAAPKRP